MLLLCDADGASSETLGGFWLGGNAAGKDGDVKRKGDVSGAAAVALLGEAILGFQLGVNIPGHW